MRYKLKVYTIYEVGQRKDADGRPHQEDSIFPAHGKASDSDRLFILCDGMGGHAAGEVASSTVCEAMSNSVRKACPNAEGECPDAVLEDAIEDAFEALDAKDSGDNDGRQRKMGTTMTCLKLHSGGATIVHMGDSRVYHIRPGKDKDSTQVLFVTEDHSLVNDLVRLRELTPEEARHSPQKNVITRAMQPHMDRRPRADFHHTADIKAGDYFYLCSDGMLEQEEYDNRYIRNNFSDLTGNDEQKVERLTEVTRDNRDNHSAIIVHILEVTDEDDSSETTELAPPAPAEEEATIIGRQPPTDTTQAPPPADKDDGIPVATAAQTDAVPSQATTPVIAPPAAKSHPDDRKKRCCLKALPMPSRQGLLAYSIAVTVLALAMLCYGAWRLCSEKCDKPIGTEQPVRQGPAAK